MESVRRLDKFGPDVRLGQMHLLGRDQVDQVSRYALPIHNQLSHHELARCVGACPNSDNGHCKYTWLESPGTLTG